MTPDTIQGLFDLAISSTRTRHSECGSRKDYIALYTWAQKFAALHNLQPPSLEECGIYYPIEDDEIAEMNQ